jgi:hypothetical protein
MRVPRGGEAAESSVSPPADEVDDLHLIAVVHRRLSEGRALEDHQIQFDGDPSRIDPELAQEFGNRQRAGKLSTIAIQRDSHWLYSLPTGDRRQAVVCLTAPG